MKKYFGILKDFDFEKINSETFPLLIESKIFDVKKLSGSYESEKDYFGIELQSTNESFNTFFLFERKEYHLKNEIIVEIIQSQVKGFDLDWILSDFENYINEELNKEFVEKKKVETLEVIYKEQYDLLKNKTIYVEYQSIKKEKNILKWWAFLDSEIELDANYSFITNYLKGVFPENNCYFPDKICSIWKECYLFEKVRETLDLYRDKVQEKETKEKVLKEISNQDFLEHNEKSTEGVKQTADIEMSSKDISLFKNDGLYIFNCITSNYSEKKNPAFFSYLFFFLKEKDLLKVNSSTDSKKYRDYIFENFNVKFPRIIYSVAQKQTERESKMNEFEDILKNFLKKDE